MPEPITPEWVAETDQLLAESTARIERMLSVMRDQAAALGEMQALANTGLMTSMLSHAELRDYLTTTLWMLYRDRKGAGT